MNLCEQALGNSRNEKRLSDRQKQTQGGAAICCNQLGVRRKRRDSRETRHAMGDKARAK